MEDMAIQVLHSSKITIQMSWELISSRALSGFLPTRTHASYPSVNSLRSRRCARLDEEGTTANGRISRERDTVVDAPVILSDHRLKYRIFIRRPSSYTNGQTFCRTFRITVVIRRVWRYTVEHLGRGYLITMPPLPKVC